MRISAFLVASAALMTLAGAAHAAERSDYIGLSVGSTSAQVSRNAYNPNHLKPSGQTATIVAGSQFNFGGRIIGVGASATLGNVQASGIRQSCSVHDCGYDETEKETETSRYGFGIVASLGDTFGKITVLVNAGIRAADYGRTYAYSSTANPSSTSTETGFRMGPVYGASVEYPVGNALVLTAAWQQANLVERRNSGSYGAPPVHYSSDVISKERTVSIGVKRPF